MSSDECLFCEPCQDVRIIELPAFEICHDCQLFLCRSCSREHRHDPDTANHRLLSARSTANRIFVSYTFTSQELPCPFSHGMKVAPGRPSIEDISSDTVTLTWEAPIDVDPTTYYQVQCKNVSSDGRWRPMVDSSDVLDTWFVARNLPSGTDFIFRVKAITEDIDSPYSPNSRVIQTQTSPAAELIKLSTLVSDPNIRPTLHKPPYIQAESPTKFTDRTKHLHICKGQPKPSIQHKTIMLVGATGTGKSTLIEAFANYVLGVSWEDPYRFTVLHLDEDERRKLERQDISQTDWVTCYTLHVREAGRINYDLTIVDTPGFGDTRGLERDEELVGQIRSLFTKQPPQGIQILDAVCVVVKASDARLTSVQRYIFNAIMSIFGKNIKHNITTLITFADGQTPPVLDSLKASELHFGKYFTFNNSALFAPNEDRKLNTTYSRMFWEHGLKSLHLFFDHLATMQSKSLTLTQDVLNERFRLKNTVKNIAPMLDTSLNKLHQLDVEIAILVNNKAEIESNRNYEYETVEIVMVKQALRRNVHVTNCVNCNFTCHDDCKISTDAKKYKCRAMTKEGNCKNCPKKCKWEDHNNTPFIHKYVEKTVIRNYEDMKKRFADAKGKLASHKVICEKLVMDIDQMYDKITRCMEVVRMCNERLAEIALQPNPLTMTQHLDEMIRTEKLEKKPKYLDRINILEQFKKRNEVGKNRSRVEHVILSKTFNDAEIVDLLGGLRNKVVHNMSSRE